VTDGGYGLTGFDELLDEGYGVLVGAEVVGVDLAAGEDEGVVVGGFDFIDEMVDFDGLALISVVPALDLAFFYGDDFDGGSGLFEVLLRVGEFDLLVTVGGQDGDFFAVDLLVHSTSPLVFPWCSLKGNGSVPCLVRRLSADGVATSFEQVPRRAEADFGLERGSEAEVTLAMADVSRWWVRGRRLMNVTTLQVLLIIFFATLIRSTFGFGEGLIAVPLLALILPMGIAAPVVVLLSITIAAVVVVQDWRKIHVRSTGWLLGPTLLGIPLGIALLTSPHEQVVKAALAIVIVAFAGYFLLGKKPRELRDDNIGWLLGCGFIAGVLGGAYGMNGPPLVIYGAMRRWSPQHFRATLQGYFLPASVIAMAGYWFAGLWTPAVTHFYLISVPAALPAIFLGRMVNRRLQGDAFLKYVYCGLVGVGLILLMQAIRHR
jgi:uncharacterized protein